MIEESQNRIFELEEQVRQLQHRLNGHREAIVRWRRRAGIEAPVEELELFKSEVYLFRGEFYTKEYYTMPIEKTPFLLPEAWAWVLEHDLVSVTDRVHFDQYDQKRGWVLTLIKPWTNMNMNRS